MDAEQIAQPPPSFYKRLQATYNQNKKYTPALAFLAGVLIDIFTLERIDHPLVMTQQAVYLLLVTWILYRLFLEEQKITLSEPSSSTNISGTIPSTSDELATHPKPPHQTNPPPSQEILEVGKTIGASSKPTLKTRLHSQWKKLRIPLIHFLFGALLSSYTVFYFKSSSLVVSFGFIAVLLLLLIANELPYFHKLKLSFKFALLSLCWISYAAYVLPIFIGTVGTGVFLISLALGLLPILALIWMLKKTTIHSQAITSEVLRPTGLVVVLFLSLYLLKAIPPVPLSIQYMGVFHGLERTPEGEYKLLHERDWWKIWHKGDQDFKAQPNDRIFVFFRLYSPSRFSHQVQMHWYWLSPQGEWQRQDRIPIQVIGGRLEGFRGFGVKSNYTDGRWRVLVTTTDEREIGRIGFRVRQVPESERQWQIEAH